MKINIVDIGLGNVKSVWNMLVKLGYNAELHHIPCLENTPDLIILPGVGSFDYGINCLKEYGWETYLKDIAERGCTRILGICLGMQLLCDGSEEGKLPGLGLISGRFVRFGTLSSEFSLKVPHMGWNTVSFKNETIFASVFSEVPRFYFVHSYHYAHLTDKHIIGTTQYGYEFGSILQRNNVLGVQFHPEKSHRFGMAFLRQFLEL